MIYITLPQPIEQPRVEMIIPSKQEEPTNGKKKKDKKNK